MKPCDTARSSRIGSLVAVVAVLTAGCAGGAAGQEDPRTGPSQTERRADSKPLTLPPSGSSDATTAPPVASATESSRSARPSDGPVTGYSRQRTVACLQERGARVGTVRGWDERRTAFADLAQTNSVEVSRRSRNVLMAFTESPEAARFLVETLTVPDDPYVLEAKGSVVMLYRPKDLQQAVTFGACLR